MGKIYEHTESKTKYFGIIYTNPKGNKYITVNNSFDTVEDVKKYWDKNEAKQGYNYIEIVPVQNRQVYLYFKYWNTQSKWKHTEKNYDLFKYVFGCDFDIFSYFFNKKIEL